MADTAKIVTSKTTPLVDHVKNADNFEQTINSIDWTKIIQESLRWAYPFVKMVCPWIDTAAGVLGQIIVLLEKAATANPSIKSQRLQTAVDGFEQYLIDEHLIPEGLENFIDPVLDWALIKVVNGIVYFLNKTYGHDWIKIFTSSKA